jgi:allophycocyanin beta subunit
MQDAITATIKAADSQGKYLDTKALEVFKHYFQTGELRVRTAIKISENTESILKETFAKSLLYSDLTRPGGSLYTTRRYAACLRDLKYFLHYATYAMLAGDTAILDEGVLNGLQETYNSLGVPIAATIKAIQAMKEVTTCFIGSEAGQEMAVYFDHIIAGLNDTEMLARSQGKQEHITSPTQLSGNSATGVFTISEPAPTSTKESVSERQHQTEERILNYVQGLLNQLAPARKELLANELEKAIATSSRTDSQDAFTASLIGRQLSQEERLELEFSSLLRYFNHRRELLNGALTASQVATLLGTSRQTPHDRVKNGSLLAILDNGVWRFPAWQFDPTGPDGVISGLPEVLRSRVVTAF